MRDLVTREQDAIAVKAHMLTLTKEILAMNPMGHSEHQIRRFIISEPTADLNYKQCVRELWARWGAYQQSVSQLRINAAEVDEINAEIEGLQKRWFFAGWKRRKRDAQVARLVARKDTLLDAQESIKIDLEYRTLFETGVFVSILKELPEPSQDRTTAEAENWKRIEASTPKGPNAQNPARGRE